MKRTAWYLIVFSWTVFCSYGQTNEQDSLLALYKSSGDQDKIYLSYALANSFTDTDSSKIVSFIRQGIELSQELNDDRGEVLGITKLARFHSDNHQPHLAIELILQLYHAQKPLLFNDSVTITDILGNSLRELGATEMAIDYKKKLIDYHRHTNNLHDSYYNIENIAFLYSQLNRYDSAELYYQKAYNIAMSINDTSTLMHCNNNIGYNYFVQNRLQFALEKYDLASQLFEQKSERSVSDSLLYAIIRGNIGDIYIKQGNYNEASEKLREATVMLKLYNEHGNPDSLHYGTYMLTYANLDMLMGNYLLAEEKMNEAYRTLHNSPEEMTKYYGILSTLYEKTDRDELAITALRKQQEINEQLIKQKTGLNKTVHALVKFQENRIIKEIKLLSLLVESEKELASLEILFITGVSFLVLIIILILFFKYRSAQRKKNEMFEIERDLQELKLRNKSLESIALKEKLDNKNKDLLDFAIDITRKHDFIKEVSTRLNNLDASSDKAKDDLTNIIFYTKSQLMIDDNLKLFQENVNKVNHEFMAELQKKYPDLSSSEQKICALLKLKLTTKEIATIKNISPDSVKVMRHRLRKKMNLGPEVNLSEYLNKII